MKKFFVNYSVIAALAVAAAFTGCKKNSHGTPDETGQVAVNLRADIEPATTLKVANDAWETGDRVGLYMKRAGQALTASGAVYSNGDNVQTSLSSGNLVATPEIYYPESGNVDFIAYYPYATPIGSGYTIDVDVAGQSSGLPQEILYSNDATNKEKTAAPVTLNFLYSLAKLEITVTGGANSTFTVADFTAMTASIEGMHTQAKLQLADGTFAGKDAKQTVTLHKTGSTATSATFEALVLPTTAADGEMTFLFSAGDKTHTYRQTTDYASASLYKLNFAIDFVKKTATLLHTVIVPRNEKPAQDISITTYYFEPETVFVEGGTFTMGSPDGVGYSNEHPEHDVTLNSFNIGKYEVTQGQWEAVMGTSISQQRDKYNVQWNANAPLYGAGDNYPMYYVSWNEAQDFFSKLNELTGKNYRVPTEAEWEYAARGGNKSNGYEYSGSNTVGDVAWHYNNSSETSHPVGGKAPNELGIYDMSGNVSELCSDWYDRYYSSEAQTNPTGPSSGTRRVVRGGSWNNDAAGCIVVYSYADNPGSRFNNVGFRLVLP
jgi:formylglycine-generating enzyme required for sulfatase activity